MKRNINRLKKQGKLPYSPSYVIEFNGSGIISWDETSKTERSYDSIQSVAIYKNKYVFIYTSLLSGFIIPFSAFASDGEREDLIEFIKSKNQTVNYCER